MMKMKHKTLKGCLWLVTLLGATSVHAQSSILSDLLERARAAEPTYLGAKATVLASQAHKSQAVGAMLPQVSANASTHDNNRSYETRDTYTPIAEDDYNSNSAQVSLTLPLWRPANLVGVKQSQIMVKQAKWQFVAAEQELSGRLVEAWFNLLVARDEKVFADRQVDALEQQWRVAARAEELGAGSSPRTKEAMFRLEQARADAVTADTEIEIKRAALEQWVGLLPEMELPHLLGNVELTNPAEQALGDWLEAVESGNPSLLAASRAREAAKADVRRLRAEHSPTLDLIANYGKNSQATGGFPGQAGYDIKQRVVGLQLNLPIYSGGTQSAKVAEAIAQEARASQEVEAARRSAVLATKQAWFAWQGAAARATAGAKAILAAQAELARVIRGSEQGLQTQLEILQAEQQLRASQRDFRKARYEQIVSLVRLKVTAGILQEADITGIDELLVLSSDAADPDSPDSVAEDMG